MRDRGKDNKEKLKTLTEETQNLIKLVVNLDFLVKKEIKAFNFVKEFSKDIDSINFNIAEI